MHIKSTLTAGCQKIFMQLVCKFANTKSFKKDLNNKWQPWDMGTHLKVLCYLMNTSMTGFRWYSIIFVSLIFGVKVALALEGLRASLVVQAMLHQITYSEN